jgi:hypothetical protein
LTGPGARKGTQLDAIELVPFAAITEADVGERAGPTARQCATAARTRASPIDENTFVYRIELHRVSPED